MSLDNKVIQSKNDKFVAKTQQIPYSPVAFEKGEGAVLFDHDGKMLRIMLEVDKKVGSEL